MLTYRAAEMDDRDLVLSLMSELYAHEKIELDARVQSAVSLLLRNPVAGRIFLIHHESELVGYAVLTILFSLEFGGPCGFLDEFLILPQFRGKGFGREALKHFMESAEKEGLVAVSLEVDRENPIARKMYDTAGFKATNRDFLTARLPRRDWLKINGVTEE